MSFQEYAESAVAKAHGGHMSRPVLIGIIAVVILCALSIAFFVTDAKGADIQIEKAQAEEGQQESDSGASEAPPQDIYVHVAGCVAAPGMYQLSSGARVAEAIQAAGGFSEEAASESVNLARTLQDGEQIVVASAKAHAQDAQESESGGSAAQASGDGRININTASVTELTAISGIGPAKAQKIVAYREEHGGFKSVEDLCQVSGIGQKTLEAMRDEICVG